KNGRHPGMCRPRGRPIITANVPALYAGQCDEPLPSRAKVRLAKYQLTVVAHGFVVTARVVSVVPLKVAAPVLACVGLGEGVAEVVTHVNFCEFMNVLNSFTSAWELVKPTPWPASTKYPRISPAFQRGGFAFRKRMGTTLLVS